VRLPHPAGDQLRVLRPEVDDEDRSLGQWVTTRSAFCSSLRVA
jgi:hypothetical protein